MKDENEDSEDLGMFDSKFWRTSITIVAVILIFAGPTYFTYALNALNIPYLASVLVGVAMLVLGVVLLFLLIRKKVII